MYKDKPSIENMCSSLCFAYITGQLEFETLEMFLHLERLKFKGEKLDSVFKDTILERYSYLFK